MPPSFSAPNSFDENENDLYQHHSVLESMLGLNGVMLVACAGLKPYQDTSQLSELKHQRMCGCVRTESSTDTVCLCVLVQASL